MRWRLSTLLLLAQGSTVQRCRGKCNPMSNQPTNHAEAVNEASAAYGLRIDKDARYDESSRRVDKQSASTESLKPSVDARSLIHPTTYRLQAGNVALVKPGYKQTEVGVIPEDWEVRSFQEIGKFAKGKGLLKEDIQTYGSIPAIPYTALYTDFSEILNYDHIKWFIDDEAQTYVTCEPCVLIASSSNMEANTGKASALIGTMRVAIGREVIIFNTAANCIFISYLLSTAPYRRRTLILARGTTIKHLYPTTFLNYPLALPPPSEQHAIAEALSDVDALLGGLERLIAKKRDLKQAAMQQLLTGQTRLPGFSNVGWISASASTGPRRILVDAHSLIHPTSTTPIDWKVTRLGDLLNICHGKSQREVEVADGPYPILATGGQIGTARHPLYDKPSVLIGRKGTINQPQYMDTPFWTVDTLFYSAIKGENSAKFLYYRFCLIDWMQYNEASGVPSLNARTIQNIEIGCPEPDEQTAIATILSDMDAELAALEARRDKTRALKEGMMQELLTGKTRLL